MQSSRPKVQVRLQPATQTGPVEPVGPGHPLAVRLIGIAVLLVLGALAAAPSVYNGGKLVLDDRMVFQNGPLYSSSGLGLMWRAPSVLPQYFPLTFTTHALEILLARPRPPSPVALRLVNLALHVGNALLLWALLSQLKLRGAWLAGALFAVLPIQLDAVAWISQRQMLLSMLLCLLSAMCLLRALGVTHADLDAHNGDHPPRWFERPTTLMIAGVLLFGMALLSGMVGIGFPLALAGVLIWRRPASRGGAAMLIGAMLVASITMSAMLVYKSVPGASLPGQTPIERLAFAGTAPWIYLQRTLLPIGLGLDLQRWAPPGGGWMWMGWIGLLVGAGTLVALRRRIPRGMIAGAMVTIALILPALGWMPWMHMIHSDTANHAAYAMVAPVMAGLAWGVCRLVRPKATGVLTPALAGVGAILVGGALTGSMVLAPHYRDLDRTMARQLALNPDSPDVLLLRARQLLAVPTANVNEAEVLIRRALEQFPSHRTASMMLAELFHRRRDFDRALQLLRQAEQIAPGSDVLILRSSIESARGRSAVAIRLLEQVLEDPTLGPQDRAEVLSHYAIIRQQRGELEEARALLKQAIDLWPRLSEARINLANVLYQLAVMAAPPDVTLIREAVQQLERVLEYDKQNAIVWLNAGAMAASMGNYTRAETLLREAVLHDPRSLPAWQNLGNVLLHRAGTETEAPIRARLYGDAVVCFRRVAELQPDNLTARETLRHVQQLAESDARGMRSSP